MSREDLYVTDPLLEEIAPEPTGHAVLEYRDDHAPLIHHGFSSQEEAEEWATACLGGKQWLYATFRRRAS